MAKYRVLTKEEFVTFEKEFIDYLVVNGITADDWVKMKEEENEKANKIMDLFSDVILETVMRKVQFLEMKTPSNIQAIQCLPTKMNMVSISSKHKDYSLSNFNQGTSDEQISARFEMHTGEKAYTDQREIELFKMTEKGYEISDGKLFKKLILATVE